ncbi:MAG: hypothetical protein SOH48_00850 [Eubacteriales bacterium]
METEHVGNVCLESIRETSRHVYEGTASADLKGERRTIPFCFSDMDGQLLIRESAGTCAVPLSVKKEIEGICENLVMEEILSFDM